MTQRHLFNFEAVDPSWRSCIKTALKKVDPHYLENLYENNNWLPGHKTLFNAFSLPVEKINYVLFGESPYPRATSANGYAFWDAAVTDLWSSTGLSKPVNRATSLRNIIKMLLVADGMLDAAQTSQAEIAKLNKEQLVKTGSELFQNFIQRGFLLLNASLVLQPTEVRKDALAWRPFIQHVLDFLFQKRPSVCLILFGNIANMIDTLIAEYPVKKLYAEHPYNLSFIHNSDVIQFFSSLHLLHINHKKANNYNSLQTAQID